MTRMYRTAASLFGIVFSAEAATQLPPPSTTAGKPLDSVLQKRRSVREFSGAALSLHEVSQLLWATQGVTSAEGNRTTPSAGALYPLEITLVAGNVTGLAPGVYRYEPDSHALVAGAKGDARAAWSEAALGQDWIAEASAILVIAAVYERTSAKYGNERGARYVHLEAGHAGQNACLEAVSLGLGATVVGAFDDREVSRLAGLAPDERPLTLLPVGRPRA